MYAMRELSDDFKLSVRSIYEVFEGLSLLVTRLANDRSIRLRELGKVKRPTRAAVVSAMILWLSELPEAEQHRIVAAGMDRLNELLSQDDSPPDSEPKQTTPEPITGKVYNPKTGVPASASERPRKGKTG